MSRLIIITIKVSMIISGRIRSEGKYVLMEGLDWEGKDIRYEWERLGEKMWREDFTYEEEIFLMILNN